MATSRVRQKIFCNGTQAKILVPNLKFGHCELSSGLVTNGGNSRTGNHRPYHSSLHASKSEQFIVINGENIGFREKQLEENSVPKSLKTITGELGAQVLKKAYKLSNNIVEWANSINKTRTPTLVDGRIEKSPRLSRRCRSCDPRHLKSAKVETNNASRFQKKDSNKLSVHNFGSAVEAIKPSLRDNLNSSFYNVLSTQSHRGYSKLRGAAVPEEESGDSAENSKLNLNETTTSIDRLYSNVEFDKTKKSVIDSDSESLWKTENTRKLSEVDAGENKERSSKQKCYPMSRNFSFAFFQPLTNAHFFTTIAQCQLDSVSNECPKTLFAPQYLAIEQNFLGRINESRESTIAAGNALVNKARGIPQKVFQIALLSYCQDLDKTKTINETFLNKLVCSCRSFLRPSLSTASIGRGELVASKSFVLKNILPDYEENNLVRIDELKDNNCQNGEEKTTKEGIDSYKNDDVVTVEGKVFNTSDETLNKLLLLVKQTKIAQENCLENPILDQILSPSLLRKQVEEKIDLLSSSVNLASDLLSDMKRNPVSQMNYIPNSSNNSSKFCGEFFSEDLSGDIEFENLKVKPTVSEKSIYIVLKAFKDIVRDNSNSVINNSEFYPSPAIANYVEIDESKHPLEAVEAGKNSYNSELRDTYKSDEKEHENQFDHVGINQKLINRFTTTPDLMQFGDHIGKSYPTFFQSIRQKNSELMLQCNSMRLHSFIANYNPNIRRASNLANNSNVNVLSRGLTKSHSNSFTPTQSRNIMKIDPSSTSIGKKLNKKKITSQALINIFNENLNLKTRGNEFSENINLYNLYDDRYDKLREVEISRVSSTYKSLLAGNSSLKVFSAKSQETEAIKLSDKNNYKAKTSINLEKVVFKPRSVGTVISSLDSNSAQLNINKSLNVNSVVTSENNSDYFKAVSKENGITRINKLNKLGKKLANSTKKEVRYSWKSNNESLSSFTATNNKESISNASKPKNTKSSSHLPLKSNHLRIFMPEKKRSIESLADKENFRGRRQFGIFNFNPVDSKSSRDVSKAKNVSFNNLRTKTSLENDIIPEMSTSDINKGYSSLDSNISTSELLTRQSGSKNSQKSLIAEAEIRGKENLLKIEIGGERKIAFDDREQIDSFKLIKPVNKVDKQSDGVTKLNSYARKLRHSIKYGSVFSGLDKSSVNMKPAGSLVAVINFRETGKKTRSNNKSSLIAKPQEGSNPFRIPLDIKDTEDVVLQPAQVENIRERLLSDRSKMSELYKGSTQHDLNLLDRDIVLARTKETEMKEEGSKYFANIFKKGGSLGSGSGSNKSPFNKNNKKDSTDGKKKTLESKPSNLSSNNTEKYRSSKTMLGGNERDAYKSDNIVMNENFNGKTNSSSSLKESQKISSIELMRSVRSDRPSKSLSAEFLVRPYPNDSTPKNRIVPRFSVEKSKDNLEELIKTNELNSARDTKMSDKAQTKPIKNLSYISEKSQSIKLMKEQNPIKTVSNAVKSNVFPGSKAEENIKNGRSENEYKIKENKLQRETILKVDGKPKSATTEPRKQPNTIESFIGSESKDNQGYTTLKQKNTEDQKYNRNKKFFNERASAGTLLEGRTKSLRVDRKPNINAEFQQTNNKSQSNNFLSILWRRDDTKKTLSNHNLNSSDNLPHNLRKVEGASGKTLFFKNNDEKESRGSRPGTSAILGSNTATNTFEFHPSEYQKVSSPNKSINSENENNRIPSTFKKDEENRSKQKGAESNKINFAKSIRPNSSPTQTNFLYRGILTKDRKDGEIRGLEARGIDYNKKKHSAEKTDKGTQTPPIVEKSRSKKVQNDQVTGSSGDHFSKSIFKSASKDVRITEDKAASSHLYSKRPSRAVFKNTVPLEATTKHEKLTKKSNSSAEYLNRNDSSSDSNGQERNQTISEPKVEGFQTMRVFADRKKETEKKRMIPIENLKNQEELFRSPLSLSRLIQTKSL